MIFIMTERAKPSERPLSRAEKYGESVLAEMRKKPEDCDLYNTLVPHIGNNPLIVFQGVGGGSADLALSYLQKLSDIHEPYCKLNALHTSRK